ncbi:hypothetical protein ABZV60_01740 [Streptomyces sp. NPDC004787]|uniref:hypothetical protein n=1 Tax=Streptomyces sp. NPDC004787 TaxID=3154291 RepID=UPI0033A72EDB
MTGLGALGLAAALLATAGAAPAAAGGSLVTVIDNSHSSSEADSVLEIDRAANLQYGSGGTAGSDHDGSAVEAVEALVGRIGAPDDA